MATNPVVQAAAEVLARDMNASMDWHRWLPEAEAVVVAVAPLIRRQAFNEAAEAVKTLMDRQPLFDALDGMVHDTYGEAVRAVRGLSDSEKENA